MTVNARSPSKFSLDSILLIIADPDGDGPDDESGSIDIRNVIEEITIYEDIDANCLTGEIMMKDGYNLPETFPITAREYVYMSWHDVYPQDGPKHEAYFSVEGIGDRFITGPGTQSYTLKLVSQEGVRNRAEKVSVAFHEYPENIVLDIFSRFLDSGKEPLQTPWNDVVDQSKNQRKAPEDRVKAYKASTRTKNKVQCIIPMLQPFQAINWIAQRAIDEYTGQPGFFFYERINQGFVLQSLAHMFRQDAKASGNSAFRFNPQGVVSHGEYALDGPLTAIRRHRSIESYTVKRSFDTIPNLDNGFIASKLVEVDYTRKTTTTTDLHYLDHYTSGSKVKNGRVEYTAPGAEKRHLEPTYDDLRGNNPTAFYLTKTNPEGHTKFIANSTDTFIDNNRPHESESYISQWYQKERMNILGLENLKMSIKVPGDSTIHAGDLVEVYIPALEASEDFPRRDDMLSGKWLVKNIRHAFDEETHDMVMELCKEALPRTLKRIAV